MNVKIDPTWQQVLQGEFDAPYFADLARFVHQEYRQGPCYPPAAAIFNAFNLCPFDRVKVVILGQDPYHEPGQAAGLCFSVADGVPFPPSLQNIFKEVADDTGAPIPTSGSLRRWAGQGVLLLNATLTVRAHAAASHAGHGWEQFTDAVVSRLANGRDHLVFILWGSHAQRKGALVDRQRHLVLASPHPSPLSASRGFVGTRHSSLANADLTAHGQQPVVW